MKFNRNYDYRGNVTSYTAENGYMIKSNACKDIFTGKMIRPDFWWIYNKNGERIDGASTLREAKELIEKEAQHDH